MNLRELADDLHEQVRRIRSYMQRDIEGQLAARETPPDEWSDAFNEAAEHHELVDLVLDVEDLARRVDEAADELDLVDAEPRYELTDKGQQLLADLLRHDRHPEPPPTQPKA